MPSFARHPLGGGDVCVLNVAGFVPINLQGALRGHHLLAVRDICFSLLIFERGKVLSGGLKQLHVLPHSPPLQRQSDITQQRPQV